jgi:hypothetical protein
MIIPLTKYGAPVITVGPPSAIFGDSPGKNHHRFIYKLASAITLKHYINKVGVEIMSLYLGNYLMAQPKHPFQDIVWHLTNLLQFLLIQQLQPQY